MVRLRQCRRRSSAQPVEFLAMIVTLRKGDIRDQSSFATDDYRQYVTFGGGLPIRHAWGLKISVLLHYVDDATGIFDGFASQLCDGFRMLQTCDALNAGGIWLSPLGRNSSGNRIQVAVADRRDDIAVGHG